MKAMIAWMGLGLILGSLAGAQEVAWTYAPPAGSVDTSPGLGDLNGDGHTEIVLCTTAGLIVALDGAGRELWRQEMRGPICIPPSVAHVTGDEGLEVLVMNRQGQVLCLQGSTGKILWETAFPGRIEWGTTALACGDVDGDGAAEIVGGMMDGKVVCLRSNGEQAWAAPSPCANTLCPALADLDGDGKLEILVSGEGTPLVCLSADGQERWRFSEDGVGGSPFVYNLDRQGPPEILIGIRENLTALDGGGAVLWQCALRREMDSALAIADADGDGEVELYAVDLSGHFVCVSPTGQVRWSASVEERARRSPSIGDVDGDGEAEILVAGYSGAVHVFAPDGRLKVRVPLPGASNATATLAVLDGLGVSAIVPVVNGPVQVLRWPETTAEARILWPEFRYDSRRAGVIPAPADRAPVTLSVDFGPMYAGTNRASARVENPGHRSLTIRLEARRDGGEPATATLESAEDAIAPELWYTVPATEAVNIRFDCAVLEGAKTLTRRTRTVHIIPFVKETADVAALLDAVEARLPGLLDAAGLDARACFLRAKLDARRGDIERAGFLEEPQSIALRDALREILAQTRDLAELSKAAEAAAAAGSTLCICGANPWAPFGGMAELAEGRAAAAEITIEAFGGEREGGAMNIFNLSNTTRTFRIELDELKQGDAAVRAMDALQLFECVETPTEMRDYSPDALPRLNAANLLIVPAWGARQLWVCADTGHLGAGEWKGGVRLRSLEVTPVEGACGLTLNVWPARLPEKQVLRNCGWGYVSSSMLKDYPDEALADQVSHGTNVFVGTFAPKAQFDAEGNLAGDIDYTLHDAYVKQHAPHGLILFCGYQGALQGPAPIDSEAYGKAHVLWLRAWVDHLAALGVGYQDFALYPVDEPGLSDGLVELYLRMARLAREADPQIRMYTDPVERIREEEIKEMLPLVDIWCPNRLGLLLKKESATKLDLIKQSGKTIWMYECCANVKHQSPLGYYRAQAWLAWHHGMTGIGFWSYCTSQDDPWFMPALRHDYLMVYPGNGVVGSKRWEAVRDGVEDYAALDLLRGALAAKGDIAPPEITAAARRLLDAEATVIAQFCGLDADGTEPGEAGLAGVRVVEDRRWEQLRQVRRETARLLEALQ